MKKFFLVTTVAFTLTVAQGQNLVPNPSFENLVSCPTSFGELSVAVSWGSPTWGTPDYFHVCNGSGNFVGIPIHYLGTQYARTGNAYAGFSAIEIGYNYREYIQAQLPNPLQTGIKYYVKFYVSLADSSKYATDDFAHVSKKQLAKVQSPLDKLGL